jgi:hypothetical protein
MQALAAHAAQVEIGAGELLITDKTGVADRVAVGIAGSGEIRVVDQAGVAGTPPCVTEGPTSVRCPASGLSGVSVFMGRGDDELAIADAFPLPGVVLDGGEGADLVEGSDLADDIFGFTGADLLRGDGGNDFFKGGQADDRCVGGAGNDDCLASQGRDVCVGGRGQDECDGGAGRDRCLGGPGRDFGFGCEFLVSMKSPF